jgi:HlyD family secretion protein
MKKVWTIGIIVLVALVVAAGALFLRGTNRSAALESAPSTATVTRGSIQETVSATGNAVAEKQVTLAFETSGKIAQVRVEAGQPIAAGQVLAHLDTTSQQWQVAQAQASLDTAQVRLEQAQAPASVEDLASAQAALDSAIANYEEVKAGPSEEDLVSARAALDSALANYEQVKAGPTQGELASAKASVDSAIASLQQAQAAYDRVKGRPDVGMSQEALNLQNATIALEQAQATYDDLANRPTKSELAAAKAQVASTEATLAQLLERPTDSELMAASAQVASAEAQLAQLLDRPKAADVAVYQAQLEEAGVALAQAQANLDDAVLVAPFEGTVLEVRVQEGEWATTGTPAIALAATGTLILEVNVDEVDVAQIAEGQTAHLSFDALPGEAITGTVRHVAPASTDVGGAVAYGVEISFAPEALPVRLGMTADVDIVVASADGVLLVPNRAIEADREAGRYYVTRQNALGATERVEVRIGLRDGDYAQIVEGLVEGDVLVLPTVPGQTSEGGSLLPFGGAGQQMRQIGGGN